MPNQPTERASAWQKLTRSKRAANPVDLAYDMEAGAAKALAHPKRMLLLDLLSDGDERTVTELVELSGISQSNVSQNLAIMRTTGLVATRRDGNQVYYRVRDPRVLKALDLLRAVAHDAARDADVLAARANAEQEEHAKRTRRIGAVTAIGLGAVVAFVGALCPLLAGGSAADVGPHVQLMLASTSLGALVDACVASAMAATQGIGILGVSDLCPLC